MSTAEKLLAKDGGSTATLRKLLRVAQKNKTTGYIKVELPASNFSGYVSLFDGKPTHAIARYESKELSGQQAYRKIWEVSYNKSATVYLFSGNPGPAVKSGENAKIAPPRMKARIVALTWGEKKISEDKRSELRDKLEAWKSQGYKVDVLEEALHGDLESAERIFDDYEKLIGELEELRKRVQSIKGTEYAYLIKDLDNIMNDPAKLHEIRTGLKEAEWKIQEKMEEKLREKEKIKAREVQKTQIYDLITKVAEKKGEIKAGVAITPTYTFDNFVVGEFNRFAYAAAKAVVENPGAVYNPLFIWSGPGLGKTHLLNAIGNEIKKRHNHLKVLYTTTEAFTNDLIDALQSNKLLEFRQKYRNVDVLIVDDVQFLAGRERTQEEFFHTFNTLFTVDKQIILACDRTPKEIPSLEQRLVSRFEGGLIAQIQPPDLESRIAILRQKCKENNWEVNDDIVYYIAQHFESNIRELEGALKKVMAFASLMKTRPTLELAKDVLKDVITEKKPVTRRKEKLEGGHSYLVEEERGDVCFKLFSEHCKKEGGLCISRKHPLRLKEKYEIENAEMYWLTDRESKAVKTVNYSLERLDYIIEEFIEKNQKGAILLDGFTYLTNNNSFDAVLNFVRRIIDVVYETDCVFMVSITPQTLDEQDLKILEREMEVLSFMPT